MASKRRTVKEDMGQKKTKAAGSRPAGISIISVVGLVLSVLAFIGGVAFVALGGAVAGGALGSALPFAASAGPLLSLMGIVTLLIGLIGIAAFFMLWKLKRTGWVLVTVIGVISIIMGLMSVFTSGASGIIGLVIWVVIVGYLWTQKEIFV